MFKGKAGSLQYLKSLGLNVPEWMVLSHQKIVSWGSHELWLDLSQALASEKEADINQRLERFQKSIKVPTEILTSLIGNGPFAVRSSASVEDSQDNSFAGIFDTKLLVENLPEAILEVWSSLFSSGALTYCKERGIPLKDLAMDVIVQQMIIGEKSGVLFQADPTGLVTNQVIVAGWGLGQGIVDDVTDTDRYVIDMHGNVESIIKEKRTFLTHENKTLIEKKVSPEKVQISVLNEKDIDKLLGASEKLAIHNENFLDIEFTFQDQKLYVLQARPITTIPPKSNLLIFDNSNIAENYPQESSPMTFSTLRRGYAENFKNLIAFMGFPEKERNEIERNLDYLVGYWGGQIYYNLNNWYSVYGLLPFGGDKAIKSFNDMVGIKSNSPIKSPSRSFSKNLRLLIKVLPKFTNYYFLTGKHHQEYKLRFKSLYTETRIEASHAKSALEIIDVLQKFEARYLEIIKIPLFNDFFSSLLNHACRSLAVSLTGKSGERIYNDLLSHREDLESSKAIYSLIGLAQIVAREKELMLYLEKNKTSPQIMAMLQVDHPAFHQNLFQHLDRFGDRSQWEMKVEVPTARENPETTIKLIINYAQSGLSQDQQKHHEREKSSRARKELDSASNSFLKKCFFNILFNKCTEALCFREDARFDRVRFKGLSRSLLLRLGDLMVRKSLLKEADDIFYLTWEELISLKHDSFGGDYHSELVDLRKKHLAKYKGLSLPDRIVVNDLSHVERFNQKKSSETSGVLFGIPCSGGKIETECVVVHDLNEAPNLNGKILIAQRTDPAWGYFFVGVKGIIIEKGSMLSHAAIISRELGIPCIINVANATTIFKTGMKLEMNGDNGEIKILN